MKSADFERLVEMGIEAIPERFLEKLDNVAIVIEDEPKRRHLKQHGLGRGSTLLGLYEGIPLADRNGDLSGILPDKITIFRKPIEDAARDDDDVLRIVRDTVWHEIAHHFGLDEGEVQAAETRRGVED